MDLTVVRNRSVGLISKELIITVGDSRLNETVLSLDGRDGLFNNRWGDNWPDMWKQIILGLPITHTQKYIPDGLSCLGVRGNCFKENLS